MKNNGDRRSCEASLDPHQYLGTSVLKIQLVKLSSDQTLVSSDPLLFVRLPLLDHPFEAFLIEVGHGDPEM